MRNVWPGLLLLGVACSGRREPDVCERTPVEIVSTTGSGFERLIFADDRGWLVVWGNGNNADAALNGVFAWRPGAAVVNVAPGADGSNLAMAEVNGGYLVCTSAGCFQLAPDLAAGPTTMPAFGAVRELGRIGGVLHAIAAPLDESAPPRLVPIDEAGAATAAGVETPCAELWRGLAWTDDGLACLVKSDPLCGDQFDEPPDCSYALNLYAADGAALWSAPAVAPFGSYSQEVQVRLAARPDGLLVAWPASDGLHVRAFDANGAALGATDVAMPATQNGLSIGAAPAGWAATWSELLPDVAGEWTLPRLLLLAPDGTTAEGAAWLADPEGDYNQHYTGGAAFGTSGGGLAISWDAIGGDVNAYREASLFRAVGCSLSASPDGGVPGCAPTPQPADPPACPPTAPAPGACDAEGGAGCFVLPTAAMTVEVGGVPQPPDWSCADAPGPISISVMPVEVSGTVRSLAGGAAVGDAVVQLFGDSGFAAPQVETTANGGGGYALTAPAGTAGFPQWRTRGDSLLDTDVWLGPQLDVDSPTVTGYDLPALSTEEAEAWAAAVGAAPAACDDLLTGRVLDCQGRPVAHVVVTVTGGAGYDGCPAFVPGTRTFYFAAPAAPSPRSALAETGADGRFVVMGVHPSDTPPQLQTYGFVLASDTAAGFGGLTLLGYGGGAAGGGTVQLQDLWPILGPF